MHSVSPVGLALPHDLCAAMRRDRAACLVDGARIGLGGQAWNLYPEEAAETTIHPCNNDGGLARSPFILAGLRDVVIDGQGARMLVRGSPQGGRGRTTIIDSPLVPFIIRDCTDVTVRNLSIDWATPATIQGTIVAMADGAFDVRLETSQRTWCWNGQLYVEGEGWTWPVRRLLMADAETGAIQPGTGDNLGAGYDVSWHYVAVADGVVRISAPVTVRPVVGAKVLFWCTNHDTGARRHPGFFIERSTGIRIEDVTIHYTWGMGVVAQDSADLAFERLVVEPSGSRRFSLPADGTHFVGCRGSLTFRDCRFQNQFDDAINAHGLYHQVVRQTSSRTLRVRTLHAQHQNVNTYRIGDVLRVCRQPHLLPVAEIALAARDPLNSEVSDLTFAADLPEGIAAGDFVENLSGYPEITISGCVMRWNRARGVLLNGNRRITVSGNRFETPGSAILIESSPIWGEAGPITDLRITGNTFQRCGTCPVWGEAVIQAVPDFRVEAPPGLPPFHGSVRVRDNTFTDCPAAPLRIVSCARLDSDLTP